MYKLWATVKKDLRILARDKPGMLLMFVMPVILAIVITAIQNSTFELVNSNKVDLIICNRDTGESGSELVDAIKKIGMFNTIEVPANETEALLRKKMQNKDAMMAVLIPVEFSSKVIAKANDVSTQALNNFGVPVESDSSSGKDNVIEPITLLYHPVLQESFRHSITGALRSSLQLVENRQILRTLYFSLNESQLPDSLESGIINNNVEINQVPVSRDGSRTVPNATQHNIPAWTIFAMFFVVVSLGSSIVKEKLNGSFIRLKTLPVNYFISVFSKQLTYLVVTLLQAAVIFSIGIWLFPLIGLPALNMPEDLMGLLVLCIISGWCAVSFAICVGIFAQTQEQANGIGAVSVVLMAALGGIMVPSFAMPGSFQYILKVSPMHWCLEAFYGLFLEGGKLKDILVNILPLLLITAILQFISLWGLKRKNLI